MDHRIGAFDFGEENSGSGQQLGKRLIRWMDHYMKGTNQEAFWEKPVHYFVMQKNEWRSAPCWPPDCREVLFYLDSRGHANTLFGNGCLASAAGVGNCDACLHDPEDPAPAKPVDPRLRRLEDSPELLDYTKIRCV